MADSEFQRPTLAENISMIRTDLFARLDINDELRRMDEDVRAKVYAGALHTVYGYIDYLAMNMLPDLCDESWLYRHAAMKRCPRKDAVAASGFMRWDGVTNGLKVSAGSVIQRDDLVQYIVQADVTSAGGVLRVPVACSVTGALFGRQEPEVIAGGLDIGHQNIQCDTDRCLGWHVATPGQFAPEVFVRPEVAAGQHLLVVIHEV